MSWIRTATLSSAEDVPTASRLSTTKGMDSAYCTSVLRKERMITSGFNGHATHPKFVTLRTGSHSSADPSREHLSGGGSLPEMLRRDRICEICPRRGPISAEFAQSGIADDRCVCDVSEVHQLHASVPSGKGMEADGRIDSASNPGELVHLLWIELYEATL